MSRLRKPVDKYTADDALKKFSDMAYSVKHKDIFEEAVGILYGSAFLIKTDLSNRMLFHCELCNKDMNSVEALESHCRSGTHQKNKDKKERESRGSNIRTGSSNFPKDTLQYKLERSSFKPIGLQMVEEYSRGGPSPSYYKCNMCGAHGKLDHMYNHIIGKKHTEKYIKSSFKLENAVLSAKERDHLREQLVKDEGVDVCVIRTITGRDYYPKKWEAEGRTSQKIVIKEETRSPSPPSPRPSSSSSSSRYRKSPPLPSPLRSPTVARDKSPMSRFRNRSPPPPPPLLPFLQITEALPPAPPPTAELRDKCTQKFDLEELMVQFNFIVKTHTMPDSDIKTGDDAKGVIDMMLKISDSLHFITKSQLEDPIYKSEECARKLTTQKEALEKIMAHVKQRMEHAWKKHHIHS